MKVVFERAKDPALGETSQLTMELGRRMYVGDLALSQLLMVQSTKASGSMTSDMETEL